MNRYDLMNAPRRLTGRALFLLSRGMRALRDWLDEAQARVWLLGHDIDRPTRPSPVVHPLRMEPYDGPNVGVTVLAAREDGTNEPAHG